MPSRLTIRPATERDVPEILSLIRELAAYERLADEMKAQATDIHEVLFGPRPAAEALMAEWSGAVAGFALFFHNCSTFLGRRGLYIEDIFVRPAFRRQGIGRALLLHLARLARERRCGRLEWAVLDWNTPAIDFYKSLGAVAMDQWTVFRVSGDALDRLADRAAREITG